MAADQNPLTEKFFHRLRDVDVDVDVGAVLKRAGIRPRRATVTTHEYSRVWHAIGELTPMPDIGLRLGRDVEPQDHNVARELHLTPRT